MSTMNYSGELMDAIAERDERPVEAYLNYLRMLARIQVGPRLLAKMDASDIVQQAILQAHEARSEFRGTTEPEKLAWLRAILANVLAAALRRYGAQARQVGRERHTPAKRIFEDREAAWACCVPVLPNRIK
jgi:DNA-directed RNA polymerase specialized sigma24 family protein